MPPRQPPSRSRSAHLRLAGWLLLGACACSRPAQPEVHPSIQATPAPAADASPAPAVAASPSGAGEATAPSAPDAGPALSIAKLLRLKPVSGTHVIEGFVTRVVPCPPCPKGAMCKPCMGDHVIVSDTLRAPENHDQLGAGDVIVFVPRPALMRRMSEGQRYGLTVRIRPMKTTAQPINDVELTDLRLLSP
ncbi:hypothetical protein HPC49_33090 [Pyxidicoccus fallax]|uniref:Lipoprotein n=1 Tax=Pyxidicoccus fallax TaxID=394095 RepID=A0A848LCZ1_9BACT|nr:hypothetical protein [Pyxidicoccus fallax]NMO16859.1 hypothetical protein [Pyxidicoccus fallax]NPC83045.1 hypothetical protein [Pyxidicoccus fallax]